MKKNILNLLFHFLSVGLIAQTVAPLQTYTSAGGATGGYHPSTTIPTYFASVGQAAVMERIAADKNGGGVMTANEFMFLSILQIMSHTFPTTFDRGGNLTVNIVVNDQTKASSVVLKSRGISANPAVLNTSAPITGTANKFEKVLAANDLTDPLGLYYYFELKDVNDVTQTSSEGNSFVHYPASSEDQKIPGLVFGDVATKYQIISIPLVLSPKTVTEVFTDLGGYDKSNWRLYSWNGNDNLEYPNFTSIDIGKGYWLIVRNSTTINPGPGTVAEATNDDPYVLNLAQGWNLIGNPYNFKISWEDVLTLNNITSGVDAQLSVYLGGTTLALSPYLDKYRGAYVHADAATPLKIPVTKNTSIGGRIASPGPDLDDMNWELLLNISNREVTNSAGGIGMNSDATLQGHDRFDQYSVPVPDALGMPELVFSHPELTSDFSKEVVPTGENYTWDFSVKRRGDSPLVMQWNREGLDNSNKKLYLFDPATVSLVDMKQTDHYDLSSATKSLKVFFGRSEVIERELANTLPLWGEPFPNPGAGVITIPFRISESLGKASISIKVYNGMGVELATIVDGEFGVGRYEGKWITDAAAGMYFLSMKAGSGEERRTKLVVR